MEIEMMIAGKKVNTNQENLNKNNMREKKIEVFTARGHVVRIPANMLKDVAKFDAHPLKKVVKEAPKELLRIPEPPKPQPAPVIEQPELAIEKLIQPVFDKPPRKTPIRSKSKS